MNIKDTIIPGGQHSLWIDTTLPTNYPTLQGDQKTDVVIIGGGITGITTASLLKKAGLKVILVESGKIASNVTGHTTAKVTSLHGYIYQYLISHVNEDRVRMYGEANQYAIDKIESIINMQKIECDFMRTPAYTYTEIEDNLEIVEKEVEVAQKIGLPASFVKETPLPFNIKGAVKFDNQAQFHPRKYLLPLAENINESDESYIFENTKFLKLEKNPLTIITDKGKIQANYAVFATQFPIYDKISYASKIYPHYAYALGVRIDGNIPKGVYYTEDNIHHSIRNQPTKDGDILIIGGGHHKAGQGGDYLKNYKDVEKYARDKFDIKSVDYFWSTMDYDTADRIPYIGKSPGLANVYLATGYGGWGMTNSMVAATVISDSILDKHNNWQEIFNPSRIKINGSFLKQNANVVKEFIGGNLPNLKSEHLADIKQGEAKIIRIDGRKIAVFRDEEGKIHAVSPFCTHLGCEVKWNNAELTWDCPCHGSRFSYDGKVMHDPAIKDIEKKETG